MHFRRTMHLLAFTSVALAWGSAAVAPLDSEEQDLDEFFGTAGKPLEANAQEKSVCAVPTSPVGCARLMRSRASTGCCRALELEQILGDPDSIAKGPNTRVNDLPRRTQDPLPADSCAHAQTDVPARTYADGVRRHRSFDRWLA